MPWNSSGDVGLRQELGAGNRPGPRGPQGEGPLLVATPWSPSLLILEPEMPQTGRHLQSHLGRKGPGCCHAGSLHCRHSVAPPAQVGWGSARLGWCRYVLCSPVPVLNYSLFWNTLWFKTLPLTLTLSKQDPSPPSWVQGLRTHEG